MSTPAPSRALLIDLDDTLLPWNTVPHWQWAWKPQGPKLAERRVRAAIHRTLRAWDRRRWHGLVGSAPPVDPALRRGHLFETLTAIAGHSLPDAESTAVVDRFDRPAGEIETFPDVLPALRRCAAEGIAVGVVTELPKEPARRALDRAGLAQVRLVAQGDDPIEARLPSKAGFRAACLAMEFPASQTVFVGDLFWSDVRAAARAGLTSVLLDRFDRFGSVEARRISTLPEVADVRPGSGTPEPAGDDPGPGPDPAANDPA
ncbi:MAG: HAD hydrolase-like protein [Thermoplasmata archaeon]|nr:HAD hydrolase-like protein [Thermoplasmata archaeon]